MAGGRSAILLATSRPLADALTRLLEGANLSVTSLPAPRARDPAQLEQELAAALNGEPEVLVAGDELFPLLPDPDEALGEGMRRAYIAMKIILRGMMRRRSGRIVALTPPLDRADLPREALRGALAGVVKSVAREAGSRGVAATVVQLGFLDNGPHETVPPHVVLGGLEEAAGAIAFAAGEAGGYVTGQVIRAGGGLDTSG